VEFIEALTEKQLCRVVPRDPLLSEGALRRVRECVLVDNIPWVWQFLFVFEKTAVRKVAFRGDITIRSAWVPATS